MAYNEVQTSSTNITHVEWNKMIEALTHSSTELSWTTFNVSTGSQIMFQDAGSEFMRFSLSGGAGILSTATGTYDFILNTDADIFFQEQGTQTFKFDYAGNISYFRGGSTTADGLYLTANSAGANPYLNLAKSDTGYITFASVAGQFIQLVDGSDQSFKFSWDANASSATMFGGSGANQHLVIYANENQSCPSITMIGGGDTTINSYADIYFYEQSNQMFKFDYSGNISYLRGGAGAGNGLFLVANSTSATPYINMTSTGYLTFANTAGQFIQFVDGSDQMAKFSWDVGASSATWDGGASAGEHLVIRPNSSDSSPSVSMYGGGALRLSPMWTGTGDTAVNGYITIEDGGGKSIKIATIA